jgi:site-specific recombinase XerD
MAAHLAATPPVDCGLDHGKGKRCTGLVFHTDRGRPLSRHVWPRQVLAEAVAAAEVRRGTVHDLRHTYASHLVLAGVPLRMVQELLGHASIRTTERYSHLAPNEFDDPRLLAALNQRAELPSAAADGTRP